MEKYSPLFWPVKFTGKKIQVLDETSLPEKTCYIDITNYRQACAAISSMKTRAVGQVLLVMYALLLEAGKAGSQEEFLERVNTAAQALNKARPTLSFSMLTGMALSWAKSREGFTAAVNGFLAGLKNKRIGQAREAAALLADGDRVLTHCNISGLMPMIADICRENNKRVSFFVTETRPYLQGARLTAWELKRAGYDVTIITDNSVALVMAEGKVNKVMVGADHLAQNGDIANKIGTYQIAILAKEFKLPFYVICPPASRSQTGKDIPIEIRPEEELLIFNGKRIGPKGAKAYYPAFDVTPAVLISKHIRMEV